MRTAPAPFRCIALAAAMLLGACHGPVREAGPLPAPTVETPAVDATAEAPVSDGAAAEAAAQLEPALPGPPPAPALPTQPVEVLPADFARLRAGLSGVPCVEDRVVQRWERAIAAQPQRLQAELRAALPMLRYVLAETERRGLPAEFALLPLVESGYRADAQSAAGPAGLWQFIASTARAHGLRVSSAYDERLAPLAATRAALDYLARLHAEFGDWRLAVMAYNAGENRLHRALRSAPTPAPSPALHHPPGLATVTYEHLARLQALACAVSEPARFGLLLPSASSVESLVAVDAPAGASELDEVARLAGIETAQLRRWNAAYRSGRIPAAAPGRLLMPESAAAKLRGAIAASHPGNAGHTTRESKSESEPNAHRVRPGESIWRIARRYGLSSEKLIAWNGLDASAPLRPGQMLRLRP